MTLFLNCQNLLKSFGTRTLFKNLSFSLFSGNRVGLIGPNGSGKSTLLKIIAGLESSNAGSISSKKGLRVGYVPQTCDFSDEYPAAILKNSILDEMQDYEKELLAKTWLSKLQFPQTQIAASRLSGGWKKRLSFAQAFINSPDLLLLDEPTNHLDLEGILWLEKFLPKEASSYLLVSHDRYFLQNTVNRVIELNPVYPEGLFSIDTTYLHFLEKKEEFLQGQLQQERSLASKARREQEWLRQSPKARTTKAQSRIDDAHEILEGLSSIQDRNRQKKAEIDFAATHRETKKLLVAKNLCKRVQERTLFQKLDFTLSPGTRMGLMGPNGSGKTTLLRLLSEEIIPDQGTIKKADELKIVYFDQHRMQLPDHLTLKQALSPTGDFVTFRDQKIHVNGWCKRFLFSPDILDMPIEKLSGGEKARISLAHLMLQPADILLLDEPTNDLDIPTLETFEETLLEFPGAVVLITHDRCMLDRICNVFLAFGNPEQNELFAEYSQWEQAQKTATTPQKPKDKREEAKPAKLKLSYMEKKEYEQIEGKIEGLERQVHEFNLQLESEENCQNLELLNTLCKEIALAENKIEQLYLRFDELDKKQKENT